MSAARCVHAISAIFREKNKKKGRQGPSYAALKIRVCSSLLKSSLPFLMPRGGFVGTTGPSVRITAFTERHFTSLSSLYGRIAPRRTQRSQCILAMQQSVSMRSPQCIHEFLWVLVRCLHHTHQPVGKGADLTPPCVSSLASPHRPEASDGALEPHAGSIYKLKEKYT